MVFMYFFLFAIVYLAIIVLMITAQWKVFSKAGQPGWACLVPIYNIYVMTQIANKPGWWTAMILLVPFANIVFAIMLIHGISTSFGKAAGFTVGLLFLGIIFWPILAFGNAQHISATNTGSEDLLDN